MGYAKVASDPHFVHWRAEAAGCSMNPFLMLNLTKAYSKCLRGPLSCTDLATDLVRGKCYRKCASSACSGACGP